ncbi:MAG TPA: YifB family Mg chelatase-like AAA ATPase [Amaricoccus sp.]|uniref:YifB family Mg chelatase-like AAA ATPase n=1 Tax=Amaricoccus sp. TaxID=1872485 RepID=UPI002C8A5979|nr:YifB family Mg chelatase-like AAA ATPase [Amaricoccus sp.]HMQ91506.1 YifB family Mg chelatase-like AAA ATPase [Amaricoccus sp.]HMR50925.1 YifB family Mg chelatase-like AAA ATPase [Amaricoccus sp.]HMR58904.1 YifB family Mg chelatase-like AAA ATPase [Amaricoccus sp.]HMT97896.1 YifB family Mg chelatase-like AAA ATPase [Amaricoccus sp.]
MVARAYTVAFQGVEARLVEVQCAIAAGLPAFNLVGLPDKAVSEARERVRAAMTAMGLALPAKRITVNLSPADLPKEGSHFDLPIALAVLAAMEVLPADAVAAQVALGELSLDGSLVPVIGALPAALAAAEADCGLICPAACGAEAAWVEAVQVIAPKTLLALVNHFNGRAVLAPARPGIVADSGADKDLRDVRGQERAKRALEIAAAGRHHLLMIGPPGSGKSMLAARLPGILPPLDPGEALETSMIHSLAGLLDEGGISRRRPFRTPHHTASMAAIVGGGRSAKPGEISLAHHGVLFLDELPEFPRAVLETLRQPIETGDVVVARANAHVRYPCRFMLVAAANPCRCGHLADAARACARVPDCGADYLGRISGPLMDRFDLRIDVPPVALSDLASVVPGEASATVAARVAQARAIQRDRFAEFGDVALNADAEGDLLQDIAAPSSAAAALLADIARKFRLSARAYHRVLRVARTIADLEASEPVEKRHVAEAAGYRLAL